MSDSVRVYLRWKFGGYLYLFDYLSDSDILSLYHLGLIFPCPVGPNPFTFLKGGQS